MEAAGCLQKRLTPSESDEFYLALPGLLKP